VLPGREVAHVVLPQLAGVQDEREAVARPRGQQQHHVLRHRAEIAQGEELAGVQGGGGGAGGGRREEEDLRPARGG
jgi:hypothetical protein